MFDAIRNDDDVERRRALLSVDGGSAALDATVTVEADDLTSAGLVSPLMLAIILERVSLLLECGADATWARPHNGFTPA